MSRKLIEGAYGCKTAWLPALPLALAVGACTVDNTNAIHSKTIYAYAPRIGAGSQPTLIPLQVPASSGPGKKPTPPTTGYTFSEQVVTTDAELDKLAEAMIEVMTSADDGEQSADAMFHTLRAVSDRTPKDSERFPSRLTKVVWSCGRPVDDSLRNLLTRFCRGPDDRYEEINAAGFTMWSTFDGRCPECVLRHAIRRDQFRLGPFAAELAKAGYRNLGPTGEQQFTLGLPTPIGHVFARSSDGPVVVVSAGGLDPQAHKAGANTVVLTFFIYFPVSKT